MIDLDFTFDESPWEAFLENAKPGERVSAAKLLTILEKESDEVAEEAFQYLEERGMELDISDLPKPSGTGAAAVRLRQEEELARNGVDIRDLSENDPLRIYLEEISLNTQKGDEYALAVACAAGDENAMLSLTNMGIKRVVNMAQEYTGRGVLLMDLIQEGSLGLWQGIRSYRQGDYASWRDRWVRNSMAKLVAMQARNSGVSRKLREALEDYRAVDERLLCDLGRNATVEEIAAELHMTVEETESVRKMLEDARLIQRAVRQPEPEQEAAEEQQAVEDTAYFQTRQRIMELLSVLSEEDAKLLTLRFGLEKGLPLTPEETGARLGLTAQEVVAREANALAMLRGQN